MIKIDFKKFGDWTAEMLRNNSSTIVGGLGMIGLALLCRKLNIPYTVLTDNYGSYGRSYEPSRYYEPQETQLIFMPSDPVEASISAIYNGAISCDFDSQRTAAAKEIMAVLAAHKDLPASTLTFAISTLRAISAKMDFDSGRRTITAMISKIGKGEI